MILTFFLVVISWVFFRAGSIEQAFEYFGGMVSTSLISFELLDMKIALRCLILSFCMICIEWIGRKNQFALEKLGNSWKPIYRYAIYYIIILIILIFSGKEQVFIYFQF